MKSEVLFDNGDHKWVFIGRDNEKPTEVIDTNEVIIIAKDQAMLLDPGGTAIFPQVLSEMTKYVSTENIKIILASHQDPDIASSLAMWMDLCPHVKVYCSWLWSGFITHFGMGTQIKLDNIPDDGMEVEIGSSGAKVYFVPAHFCHSSGNFHCYDPVSDIFFSGDIGAALLPDTNSSFYVEDFSQHIKYMEAFHKRWMPSNSHLKAWVRRVRAINPKMIVPQHGSIFKDENVAKFLNWLDNLDVGKWSNEQEEQDLHSCPWMKWKRR